MARKIEMQINHETYVGDTSPARDQVEMLNIASRFNLLPIVREDMGDRWRKWTMFFIEK